MPDESGSHRRQRDRQFVGRPFSRVRRFLMQPTELDGTPYHFRLPNLLGRRGLSSAVSRSCLANAASQPLCGQLSLCLRRRHLGRESPHLVGKLLSSLCHQNITDHKPSPLYLFSRLKKSYLPLSTRSSPLSSSCATTSTRMRVRWDSPRSSAR